jgi:pilus assembly protein CpaC
VKPTLFVTLTLLTAGLSEAQTKITIPDLTVSVNKSLIVTSPDGIRRISVANGDLVEAVPVSRTELLLNGKTPGDTSLVVWDTHNARKLYDVRILPDATRIESIREALKSELPGQNISINFEGGYILLRGTTDDLASADRAVAICSTLGKVVNLLHVAVPASEPQVLLKVRFANVDRTASSELGANFFRDATSSSPGSISTGQFGGPPKFDFTQVPATTTIPDPLNIFLFKPSINVGAYIKALAAKQLAQILAEPNLLTLSGHAASFLAGGEFPFPTLQGGGAGVGQVTIQFREFGIRLNFRPTVTPRGTIRLMVNPEVSSLDPANGLTVSGFTVPGLDTRKVQTDVELQNGQSLVIAGLLDNRLTETISKIPGLANIPLLGKLFESRSVLKNNSELLVVVTPEIVQPIPAGAPIPTVKMPKDFMKDTAKVTPQNPVAAGENGNLPRPNTLPVEVLTHQLQTLDGGGEDQSSNNSGIRPVLKMTPDSSGASFKP